jgi:hypothetical protein
MASAATTRAIRAAVEGSLKKLASWHGLNQKTVAK